MWPISRVIYLYTYRYLITSLGSTFRYRYFYFLFFPLLRILLITSNILYWKLLHKFIFKERFFKILLNKNKVKFSLENFNLMLKCNMHMSKETFYHDNFYKTLKQVFRHNFSCYSFRMHKPLIRIIFSA